MVAVYAPERLITQARKLAAEYRRTMGKPLPGLGGEIAEHDAIRLLHLVPHVGMPDTGYQALDPVRSGKRLQIKSRTIFDDAKGGQRVGQLNLERVWDSLLLVLMDADYEPYEIHEIERYEILAYVDKVSPNRRKRGALSVARLKIIGALVWTRETGLEPPRF